jgi:hypothetical protein
MEVEFILDDEVPEGHIPCGLPFIFEDSSLFHRHKRPPSVIKEQSDLELACERALEKGKAQGADALQVGFGVVEITREPEGYSPGRATYYFPMMAYKKNETR